MSDACSDLGHAHDYIETEYRNPLENMALFAANKAAKCKGLFGRKFWLQIGLILNRSVNPSESESSHKNLNVPFTAKKTCYNSAPLTILRS